MSDYNWDFDSIKIAVALFFTFLPFVVALSLWAYHSSLDQQTSCAVHGGLVIDGGCYTGLEHVEDSK